MPLNRSSLTQGRYSEVCTTLRLGNLADLKFTESSWDMPLSSLVEKRNDPEGVRIIEKNGVRLLTDSVAKPISTGCRGLSAGELSQAATALSPHNSPAGPVDSESGAGSEQTPLCLPPIDAIRTRSFQPINSNPSSQHRDKPTESSRPTKRLRAGADAAGELCQSNSGCSATPERPSLNLLADVAGFAGRNSGNWTSLPRESGVGDQGHLHVLSPHHVAAGKQVDGDAPLGEETAGVPSGPESDQRTGTPVGLASDAAVGDAALPPQPWNDLGQPTSEEDPGVTLDVSDYWNMFFPPDLDPSAWGLPDEPDLTEQPQ